VPKGHEIVRRVNLFVVVGMPEDHETSGMRSDLNALEVGVGQPRMRNERWRRPC
jgi:hypothetical protein